MGRLNAALRKRLALEARKLAMECVEGAAPHFDRTSYCDCAVGEVVKRTGCPTPLGLWHTALVVDKFLSDEQGCVVSAALFEANSDPRLQMEFVAFPLLALADELDPLGSEGQTTGKPGEGKP